MVTAEQNLLDSESEKPRNYGSGQGGHSKSKLNFIRRGQETIMADESQRKNLNNKDPLYRFGQNAGSGALVAGGKDHRSSISLLGFATERKKQEPRSAALPVATGVNQRGTLIWVFLLIRLTPNTGD